MKRTWAWYEKAVFVITSHAPVSGPAEISDEAEELDRALPEGVRVIGLQLADRHARAVHRDASSRIIRPVGEIGRLYGHEPT